MYGEVMDVPAASVMTAEDRSDYPTSMFAYKAHSRVPLQVSGDVLSAVGGAQSDTAEAAPEGVDVVVIGEIKGFDEQRGTSLRRLLRDR